MKRIPTHLGKIHQFSIKNAPSSYLFKHFPTYQRQLLRQSGLIRSMANVLPYYFSCSAHSILRRYIHAAKPPSTVSRKKSNLVTVEVNCDEELVSFRVPATGYTFEELVQDSKRYFGKYDLGNNSSWYLRDQSGSIIPFSSLIGDFQHDNSEPLSFSLVQKGSTSGRTNNLQVPETFSQPQDDFKTKLRHFRESSWVREQIKDSKFYFESQQHLESAFNAFSTFVDIVFEDPHQSTGLPLTKIMNLKELFYQNSPPHTFCAKVLPIFFDFLSSQTNFFPHLSEENKATTSLRAITRLSEPHQWYQAARSLKRKIYLHVGPTNSGKTHKALSQLSQASAGMYLSPLRLLAHEVHEKLNNQGVLCNLVTGQQRVEIPGSKHVSSTVEMADLTRRVDVAIIDEIQMIANVERGWAWTKALLGLMADEIHLCGDPSSLQLIERIGSMLGEDVHVCKYERLSPLIPSPTPLASPLQNLSKGDCIIAFSRKDIHEIKKLIEENSSLRYGSLPPESRSQQAALFNDPDSGYDVLIASDAIGMGLNLNIKRIIFSTLEKFDGKSTRFLTPSEIRQIAGRAGRFGSVFPSGEVTCLNQKDIIRLHRALSSPIIPLKAAGLLPSYEHFEVFSRLHDANQKYEFSQVLKYFLKLCTVDSHYFLCDVEDSLKIAKLLDGVDISYKDFFTFISAPADTKNSTSLSYLLQYAHMYASSDEVPVGIDMQKLLVRSFSTKDALAQFETYHQICDLYLWLSMRFDKFSEQRTCFEIQTALHSQIESLLAQLPHSHGKRHKHFFRRKIQPRQRHGELRL